MSSPPHLKKLSLRDSKIVVDEASGKDVYHVSDPHALVQASGYLKYTLGPTGKGVLFRGQTKNHPKLSPGLYRGCSNHSAQARRESELGKLLTVARQKSTLLADVATDVREPLLQHYGLKTTWVDLVDNIWIALWFACHQAKATGKHGEFLHFERRLPRKEKTAGRFAYVVMVAADNQGAADSPGCWRGSTTELVDLRIAAPSVFLRPHAQHAVLFRLRGNATRRDVDYASAVCGVIRVGLDDALDWLGNGTLLGVHTLFPPVVYDHGYSVLLEDWPTIGSGDPTLGTVGHVGA